MLYSTNTIYNQQHFLKHCDNSLNNRMSQVINISDNVILKKIRTENVLTYGLYVDDNIKACVVLITPKCWNVYRIYTDINHRQQGLMTLLFKEIIKEHGMLISGSHHNIDTKQLYLHFYDNEPDYELLMRDITQQPIEDKQITDIMDCWEQKNIRLVIKPKSLTPTNV